jgi:hypothetical protein
VTASNRIKHGDCIHVPSPGNSTATYRAVNNLPFLERETPYGLERVRFAPLTLSQGSMEKLRAAVKLANADWRDLLVAAGFADSADVHKHWSLR